MAPVTGAKPKASSSSGASPPPTPSSTTGKGPSTSKSSPASDAKTNDTVDKAYKASTTGGGAIDANRARAHQERVKQGALNRSDLNATHAVVANGGGVMDGGRLKSYQEERKQGPSAAPTSSPSGSPANAPLNDSYEAVTTGGGAIDPKRAKAHHEGFEQGASRTNNLNAGHEAVATNGGGIDGQRVKAYQQGRKLGESSLSASSVSRAPATSPRHGTYQVLTTHGGAILGTSQGRLRQESAEVSATSQAAPTGPVIDGPVLQQREEPPALEYQEASWAGPAVTIARGLASHPWVVGSLTTGIGTIAGALGGEPAKDAVEGFFNSPEAKQIDEILWGSPGGAAPDDERPVETAPDPLAGAPGKPPEPDLVGENRPDGMTHAEANEYLQSQMSPSPSLNGTLNDGGSRDNKRWLDDVKRRYTQLESNPYNRYHTHRRVHGYVLRGEGGAPYTMTVEEVQKKLERDGTSWVYDGDIYEQTSLGKSMTIKNLQQLRQSLDYATSPQNRDYTLADYTLPPDVEVVPKDMVILDRNDRAIFPEQGVLMMDYDDKGQPYAMQVYSQEAYLRRQIEKGGWKAANALTPIPVRFTETEDGTGLSFESNLIGATSPAEDGIYAYVGGKYYKAVPDGPMFEPPELETPDYKLTFDMAFREEGAEPSEMEKAFRSGEIKPDDVIVFDKVSNGAPQRIREWPQRTAYDLWIESERDWFGE